MKCVVLKNMRQCLVYLTRARTRLARFEVQRGNHEATLPLTNPYIPHRCPPNMSVYSAKSIGSMQTFFGLSRVPPHETFVERNA